MMQAPDGCRTGLAGQHRLNSTPSRYSQYAARTAGALAVFAVLSFVHNRSLPTTLLQTAVCGALIQVGYLDARLFMAGDKRHKPSPEIEISKGSQRPDNHGTATIQRRRDP